MHIVFVTSEVAGVYKIGGLADVSQSLPKALGGLGHTVDILLPYYTEISSEGVTESGYVDVQYAGSAERVIICEKTTPASGVRLWLLKHPKCTVYHGTQISDTFIFFSFVAARLCSESQRYFGTPVDVIHCHDWHTALVPFFLDKKNISPGLLEQSKPDAVQYNIPSLLTIHNLMYAGDVPIQTLERSDVPRGVFDPWKNSLGTTVGLLRLGLEYATTITTVSPTYAKEIAVPHTSSIGDVLVRRKSDTIGIVNGIDTDSWNPKTDRNIQYNYDIYSVDLVKKMNKKSLLIRHDIATENPFLIGFVGRIEPHQKGIDIVMQALSTLLNVKNIHIIILGTGEDKTEALLRKFSIDFSPKVSFINEFNDKIARQIYSGCDAILVPSKFEPCGLTQIIAMRYGTLPIVRKTGGLADTVSDMHTGFVFTEYTGADLTQKIVQAYDVWQSDTVLWAQMTQEAMKTDYSWKLSAASYVRVYTRISTPRSDTI